ncbi:hypothetical protein XELAEV_18030575mg [Xenopus laevis]|uniref:Uncharacterized protein n=1 Tax=Xenopus laevis TaxID=8355 RepID=A0A974CMJ0_XENLA|nr:hypothetical protein XELAEV_18030575mg [Xenopus laevis]
MEELFCAQMELTDHLLWPGPSVVTHSVFTTHFIICLGKVHLWFLILYVPSTVPSVWPGFICYSLFCMCHSSSPLSGQGPSVVPHSVCTS